VPSPDHGDLVPDLDATTAEAEAQVTSGRELLDITVEIQCL
jgi:hypothetical protein